MTSSGLEGLRKGSRARSAAAQPAEIGGSVSPARTAASAMITPTTPEIEASSSLRPRARAPVEKMRPSSSRSSTVCARRSPVRRNSAS